MLRRATLGVALVAAILSHAALAAARPIGEQNLTVRAIVYQQNRWAQISPPAGGFRTLQAGSMHELVQWTAPVSKSASVRYGGDFSRYWQAANSRNQRLGNTLEAVLAWRANQQQIRRGLPSRFIVTAVEGFRQHVADLVEMAKSGSEMARYQSKLRLTLRSAARYLADPRYGGMKLLTTRQSHATVMEHLAEREANAARRGIKLAPRWQRVRDAIDSNRLPARFAGKALPTERGLEALARKAAQEQFYHASRTLQPQSGSLRLARFGGYLFVAADLAMSGYLQYKDMRRYEQGDLSEDMLMAKTGVRGIQCALAVYAATSPEPFTKVTTGIVVVVLTADAGLELIQQRRELAAREILDGIDREEQFHAVRAYLLKEFHG